MAKPTKSDLEAGILALDPEAVLEGRTNEELKTMLKAAQTKGNAHATPGDPVGDAEAEINDLPDPDAETSDESAIEEVFGEDEDEDTAPVERMIIVKSLHKGAVYALPMGDPKKTGRGAEHRSLVAQLGYQEVVLSIWEAVRSQCLKKGFTEHGRKIHKGVVTAKVFTDFTPKEQGILARNCNDVKTLRRWQQLPGMDAAVMTAVNAQIDKIVNWKPGK